MPEPARLPGRMRHRVTGELAGGGETTVEWEDGRWSGPDDLVAIIGSHDGQVSLTPTGPRVAADSVQAVPVLAASVFARVVSVESDLPMLDLPALPVGAVA